MMLSVSPVSAIPIGAIPENFDFSSPPKYQELLANPLDKKVYLFEMDVIDRNGFRRKIRLSTDSYTDKAAHPAGVIRDAFDDTNGTLLSAHAPDEGVFSWLRAFGNEIEINNNEARAQTPITGSFCRYIVDLGVEGLTQKVSIRNTGGVVDHNAGLILRYINTNNYHHVLLENINGVDYLRIYQRVSGFENLLSETVLSDGITKLQTLVVENHPDLISAHILEQEDIYCSAVTSINYNATTYGLTCTLNLPGVHWDRYQAHKPVFEYLPYLKNAFNFESSLFTSRRLSGRSRTGIGIISFYNNDGELDSIVPSAWDTGNYDLKVGAREFALSEFGSIFKGRIEQATWNESTVSLHARDLQTRLDVPVQTSQYLGTGGLEGGSDIKGKNKPLLYGLRRNITPVLVDVTNRIYQIHDGPINAVLAVYFNGALAAVGTDYTVNLNNGTITLQTNPLGLVTCDVEGDVSGSGYVNTVADIAHRICVDKGGLQDGVETNNASFAEVNSRNATVSGIYISDETVSEALDKLLSSVGGFWIFSKTGAITIGILRLKTTATVVINEDEIKRLERIKTPLPNYQTKIGYQSIETVQSPDQVAGSVSEARKLFLSEKIRYATASDPAVKARHQLSEERVIPTLLDTVNDADAEAIRQQQLFGSERDFYEVTTPGIRHDIQLGETIGIKHQRYGLADGKPFLLVGLVENVSQNTTNMVVWG